MVTNQFINNVFFQVLKIYGKFPENMLINCGFRLKGTIANVSLVYFNASSPPLAKWG